MAKKDKAIRWSVTLPPEADKALKQLAKEWDVSAATVMKSMLETGLTVEAARRSGFTPHLKDSKGRETPLPDSRPKKLLAGGWPKIPNSTNETEDDK